MRETFLAWHFVADTLRDGRPIPPDGEKLVHDGKLDLCTTGLHASERLIDALQYAPGHMLCRVEMSGNIIRSDDKLVASERTILWRVDAESILFEFSLWAALKVTHLWDAPDVVRKYLETGDDILRAAAEDAARAAAEDAEAAAEDAAWTAAWAAEDAAWTAAWAAARAAAWAAARAAARVAAEDAARAAARVAAWDDQNKKLTEMVMTAHREEES